MSGRFVEHVNAHLHDPPFPAVETKHPSWRVLFDPIITTRLISVARRANR
jgi:hypothetical protein